LTPRVNLKTSIVFCWWGTFSLFKMPFNFFISSPIIDFISLLLFLWNCLCLLVWEMQNGCWIMTSQLICTTIVLLSCLDLHVKDVSVSSYFKKK
jgi:hypothetical protein